MTLRNKPTCTGGGAYVESKGRIDHCCYWNNKPCPYLVEDTAGRRYACGLLIKYGSWKAMNRSPEYQEVGGWWASRALPFNYCETFDPAFCCRAEYRQGRANEKQEAVSGDMG